MALEHNELKLPAVGAVRTDQFVAAGVNPARRCVSRRAVHP